MATRTKATVDHDEIRRWVEERGGWPAEVESTAGEGRTGILRIDFPGFSGEGKLRRIDWDEFFRKFDDSNLALIYQEETGGGQRSNFNKLVGRETVDIEHGIAQKKRIGRGRGRREMRGAQAARTTSRPRKAATSRGRGSAGRGRATVSRRTRAGAAKGRTTKRRPTKGSRGGTRRR